MTLTKYEDVQRWFNSNQAEAGEDGNAKNAVHWTLYGGNYGEKEARLLSNQRINKPDESLAYLIESIRMMNNPPGAKFRIQIYRPNNANNYTAQTYVQIFDNATAPATGSAPQAGIGSLPAAFPENYIQERIDLALLKRENEELKAAINGPGNTWERLLDIISQSEPLSMALAGLISNVTGKPLPALQQAARPVTGSPAPDEENDTDEGSPDADPQTVFADSINAAAAGLDTDPLTMARKLRKIVRDNPAFAKQIFSQI